MNNKLLLIAIFATAFSGINLVANIPINVENAEQILSGLEHVGTMALNFSEKEEAYCQTHNTELCKQLAALFATNGNPEEIKALLNNLQEEISTKNSSATISTILEEVASETKEVTKEVHTTLMVIPHKHS